MAPPKNRTSGLSQPSDGFENDLEGAGERASGQRANLTKKFAEPESAGRRPEVASQPLAEKGVLKETENRGALALGAGFVFMGAVVLLSRLLEFSIGDYLWPLMFLVPGLVVFFGALSSEGSSAEGLVILGSILSMLGFIFLFQTITDSFQSWVYVWALVAPTSIGLAQMVFGVKKGRDAIVRSGRSLTTLGLTMFAVGFLFFEGLVGISGFGLRNMDLPFFPTLLIAAGLIILVKSLWGMKK